jgi:hypothetical protein
LASQSVESRVEDLVGEIENSEAVTQWASDAAKEVLSILPNDVLWTVSTSTADTGSGVSLTTGKFLYAANGSYRAIEIEASNSARASDSSSIHYRTSMAPVFYREGGKVYIVPSGSASKVHYVSYPTIAYDDVDFTGVPDEVKHLVMYGTAVRARMSQLEELRDGVKDIAVPSYTLPSVALPGVPSIADLSISAIAPTKPVDPSFASVAVSATSATLPSSPPSYVKPSLSLTSAPTITALSITSTSPVAPGLSDNSISFSQTAPTYTQPVNQAAFSTAASYIETNEDVELANSELKKVTTQLQEFSQGIENAVNVFNKENTEYQALLQKAIQDAQLSQADDAQKIQQYSADVGVYQADVNKEIQEWVNNNLNHSLATWQKERNDELAKYQADMQNELSGFNASNAEYQTKVAKMSGDLQVDAAKAQKDADIELQRNIQEYQSRLAKYQADVADYQAEVSKEVTQYTTNELSKEVGIWTQESNQKIGLYTSDIQNRTQEFSSSFGVYNKKIDTEFGKHGAMMQELQILQAQYSQGLQFFVQQYKLPEGGKQDGK